MKHLVILLVAVTPMFLWGQIPQSSEVELALQRIIQDEGLKHGTVGFLAVNLDNGRVLAEHNSSKSMTPASIQKLITTGCAIEQLGPDFQFETEVYSSGEGVNGVLKGNIVVVGSGDPTLESRYNAAKASEQFNSLLTGVDKIDGQVIIDASHFTKHTTPRGWIWEDMGNYFGASPSAFMWKDNMLKVVLRSGQVGSKAMLAKPYPNVDIEIEVTAAEGNKDDAWFFGSPQNEIIYAKGTIPAHKASFPVKAAHPFPENRFVRETFPAKTPASISYTTYDLNGYQKFGSIKSPSLAEIAKQTNTHSINLYAEALNIELDKSAHNKSVEGGIASIEAYAKGKRVSTKGTRFIDGSGLSPLNRTTAQFMVDFLGAMYRSEHYKVFYASMPIGGQTGTLKYYFKDSKATGNLRAKSGTMQGVRNYAGYVTNKYDETIAFCLLLNDYDADRRTAIMKQLENLVVGMIED